MTRLMSSFGYAFSGLRIAWREEASFRIQVVSTLLGALLAWQLQLSRAEDVVLTLTIVTVLAAEVFNTALEELCDKFQPTHDPHIGKIKDLSAAAVLLTSIGAFVIGLIIFIPHL